MDGLQPRSGAARSALPRWTALLQGVTADYLLRPWFDAVALPGIVRWYFPLSRAWAAATLAGTDAERFCAEAEAPDLPRRMVELTLLRIAARQRHYDTMDALWDEAFFGAAPPPAA